MERCKPELRHLPTESIGQPKKRKSLSYPHMHPKKAAKFKLSKTKTRLFWNLLEKAVGKFAAKMN